MEQLWRPGRGLAVIPVVQNRFLFQFGHKADADRVINKGPWSYDNANIIIQRISPGEVAKEVMLDKLEIWVQVHGLPFGYVQEKTGTGCGAFLGVLHEYDSNNWIHSKYMRLRVAIDVNKPLKKEMKLTTNKGSCTVYFKYEKLGTFCYRCGLLGHTDKSCPKIYDETVDDGVRMWPNSLKSDYKESNSSKASKWFKDPKEMIKEAEDVRSTENDGDGSSANGMSNSQENTAQSMSDTNNNEISNQLVSGAVQHDKTVGEVLMNNDLPRHVVSEPLSATTTFLLDKEHGEEAKAG